MPIEQLAPGERARGDVRRRCASCCAATARRSSPTGACCSRSSSLTDFARKVVGVGSVGTRAWIALLLGRDGQDPLFLQMKEAEASVLEEFLGPSEFSNHGQRVVAGQRLMQATSDIFLGWLHVDAGHRRPAARLLRPPAEGLEGLGGDRADGPQGHGHLRQAVRLDAGPRARPQRRPHRDRRLPRQRRQLRPRDRSSSPRPTPSRTSATTRRSSRPSSPAGSRPKQASDALPDVPAMRVSTG